jgi:hypothetical protein
MKRSRLVLSIALLGAMFALSACKQQEPNNGNPPSASVAALVG